MIMVMMTLIITVVFMDCMEITKCFK